MINNNDFKLNLKEVNKLLSGLEKFKKELGMDINTKEVNHPPHYNKGNIEVIDYIEDQGLGKGFCLGNAIKYISRAGSKDPKKEKEDIQKSIWYLERYLTQLENDDSTALGYTE